VRHPQIEQSCNQRAVQEPNNDNCQQLNSYQHHIQMVERHVMHDGHQLMETAHWMFQLFD